MRLIKSQADIDGMRAAARATSQTLDYIRSHVRAGVTTERLNVLCYKHITQELDARPASLGYRGFPKSICTSVNNVVCHGIPNPKKKLTSGDIINIDVALIKDGYYGDSSRTFGVGRVNQFARRLCEVTRAAMYCGIRAVQPGNRLGDIGAAIQSCAEAAGFSIVPDYCGHGLGKHFHCEPQVLHYGNPGEGMILKEGMCFTIEPMVNAGQPETHILADGWTVVTDDGKLSAQWEHTVLVSKEGCEVLTQGEAEVIFEGLDRTGLIETRV